MQISILRKDIVDQARAYLGVKWVHQGRTKQGLDCVGLVVRVAHDLRLSDYDSAAYQRRTVGAEFIQHFEDNMFRKRYSQRKAGDVLLLRDKNFPCHVGILAANYRGDETMIHAAAIRKAVVEERLDQGGWAAEIFAVYEFKGLGD